MYRWLIVSLLFFGCGGSQLEESRLKPASAEEVDLNGDGKPDAKTFTAAMAN